MITEPEMADGPEQDRPAGVPGEALAAGSGSGSEPAPRPGPGSRYGYGYGKFGPWRWAVGGVAVACAIWTTVLTGTGYGRTPAPDLHGYHLTGSLCTSSHLAPLVDVLPAEVFAADNPPVRRGPSLDRATCTLAGSAPIGGGWTHTYVITVSVDLHRRTDPRAEFEDTAGIQVAVPVARPSGVFISMADGIDSTRPYPGLGDRAYLTTGTSRQALSVLHGGAVLSVIVDASTRWPGADSPPANLDGSFTIPPIPGSTAVRPALAPTVRHLMALLSGH